jgi:hypothetical protein
MFQTNSVSLDENGQLMGFFRGCIQKFPDSVDNEMNNKHSLRSNIKGYGDKTH